MSFFTPFAFVKSAATTPVVYMSASGGNSVVTDGNFKIHYFTSAGTFTVTQAGKVEIYAVAGGGGAGEGGGGGGGVIAITSAANYNLATGSYSITIGNGGSGYISAPGPATSGQDTTIDTIGLTAKGGGRGGMYPWDGSFPQTGTNGGSGGGSRNTTYSTGSQPTQSGDSGTYGFGNSGGIDQGGGGGASAAGTDPDGGEGYSVTLYSGDTRVLGSGGAGIGGVGGTNAGNSTAGQRNATANYGGGGGAASVFDNAGNGGSGIVIFKYQFQA